MTVATTNNRNDYTATAAQTTFPYTFRIFANADLKVYVNTVLKTLTTDYTVTGADAAGGGNVVFGTGLAAGDAVAILRSISYTQGTDYVENDPFPAETHEKALDRLTMLTQQLTEVDDRSFKLPVAEAGTTTLTTMPTLASRKSMYLAFNADGTPIASTGTGADAGLRADLASTANGLGVSLVARSSTVVDTIAALRLIPAPTGTVSSMALVKHHSTTADAGGGTFYWDSTSTATDDPNSGVIKPSNVASGDPGRWRRIRKTAQAPYWRVVIPGDNFVKHKAFGVTDVLPSGRIVHVYREANTHGLTVGDDGIIRTIYSDDNGVTWSTPLTLHSIAGRDLRNIGGGVTSTGKFYAMYESVNVADTTKNDGYVVTTTDGITWTAAAAVWTTALAVRLVPYGKMVQTTVGIFQSCYYWDAAATNGSIYMVKSTDDAVTWTVGAAVVTGTGLTETSCIVDGSNRIICVSRNDQTPAAGESSHMNRARTFGSTDGGATWTFGVQSLTRVAIGTDPPILWYDKNTKRALLVYNQRNHPRGHWLMSSIDVDYYFAATANAIEWRNPIAMPLPSLPSLGTRQFGEGTYTPLVSGATTAPQYSVVRGNYYLHENGLMTIEVNLSGDGGNEGAGAGGLSVSIPKAAHATCAEAWVASGYALNGVNAYPLFLRVLRGATTANLNIIDGVTFGNLTGDLQNNVTRVVNFQFTYRVDPPAQGENYGADGDYPHIIDTRAGLRMVYFAGAAYSGQGTDFWIANLDWMLSPR